MTLDNRTPGAVKVSMTPYMHNVVKEFPEAITMTMPLLATGNLFKVRGSQEQSCCKKSRQ